MEGRHGDLEEALLWDNQPTIEFFFQNKCVVFSYAGLHMTRVMAISGSYRTTVREPCVL